MQVPDVVLNVVSRIDEDCIPVHRVVRIWNQHELRANLQLLDKTHPVDTALVRMAEAHDSATVAVNALDGISVGVGLPLQ